MIDIKRLEWDREYWDEVAPEGANRYYDRPHYQCFLKHSSLDHLYHLSSEEWYPIPGYAIQSHLNSSFPRPEPRQVEWDGEGLPPVGCECEYQLKHDEKFDDWSRGRVKYKGDKCVVMDTWPDDEFSEPLEQTFKLDEAKFRPICTRQQRQRDELASIIREASPIRPDGTWATSIIDTILSHYNLEPKKMMDKLKALVQVYDILEKEYAEEYDNGYLSLEITTNRPLSDGVHITMVYVSQDGDEDLLDFGVIEL